MWSRPHPSQAKADDPIGQPDNFELVSNSYTSSSLRMLTAVLVAARRSLGRSDDNCSLDRRSLDL